MASPRVLKVTFEFHVPPGLKANIRFARIEAAVAAFSGAIEALAPRVFPWADRVVVKKDWSYQWWADKEEIPLSSKGQTATEADVPDLDEPVELEA